MNFRFSQKTIVLAAAVLLAAAGAYFFYSGGSCSFEKATLSLDQASQKTLDFVNESIQEEGITASLVEAVEESGVYQIEMDIADTKYVSFITKDGRFLFPSGYDLKQVEEDKKSEKTDRPDVKLFVMSYCPYGLQMQKAYLPVYDLLKDKADMGIYFVDYIMHGKDEIDENLRQYCIQEEQPEKYYSYLSCFLQSGDTEGCLSSTSIDLEKMESCVSEKDSEYQITEKYEDESTWLQGYYPLFDLQADLNDQYGISGSPTLIINGKEVNPSRSPESLKTAVCAAFNDPPEECSQTLSEETFTPSFGLETAEEIPEGDCQ